MSVLRGKFISSIGECSRMDSSLGCSSLSSRKKSESGKCDEIILEKKFRHGYQITKVVVMMWMFRTIKCHSRD